MAATPTSTTGVGQFQPGDADSDVTVIAFIARQLIAQLDTMKPCQVVKVTGGAGAVAKAGTVDVQLLVSLLDGGGNSTQQGIVSGLPYMRLQGGPNAIIIDPVVGDIGFVVCSDRDISNLKAAVAGGKSPMVTPGSYRKYSVSDGIYVPGFLNGVPTQYLAFADKKIAWVDANGNMIVSDNTGVTITDLTGNVVKTSASGIALTPKSGLPVTVNGALVVTGNLQLGGSVLAQAGGVYGGTIATSGDITAGAGTGGSVGLRTHTHTQGNDSHGDTEGPTSAPTGGT